MITNKSIDSNCKRIAQYIISQTRLGSEQFDNIFLCGFCVVYISQKLKADILGNRQKYIRNINKQLKGYNVKFHSFSNVENEITFDIAPESADL